VEKPIIGILGNTGNTYKTQSGLFSSAERMYVNSDYIEGVLNNGGIPMAIPAVAMKADPEGILAVCDGILVPGGEDLNPWYYGEEPKPQIQTIRVRRSTRPGLHLDGQQKRWECLCLASAREFSF
jgi:putative glutamine amidotransferase